MIPIGAQSSGDTNPLCYFWVFVNVFVYPCVNFSKAASTSSFLPVVNLFQEISNCHMEPVSIQFKIQLAAGSILGIYSRQRKLLSYASLNLNGLRIKWWEKSHSSYFCANVSKPQAITNGQLNAEIKKLLMEWFSAVCFGKPALNVCLVHQIATKLSVRKARHLRRKLMQWDILFAAT